MDFLRISDFEFPLVRVQACNTEWTSGRGYSLQPFFMTDDDTVPRPLPSAAPSAPPQRFSWITHGSLLGATWRLALPMMGQVVLQNLYTLVDMWFVGRLGPTALSAVGISGNIVNVLWTAAIGIVTGSTAIISLAVGAGDRQRAQVAAGQSLLLALVVSVFGLAATPLAPRFLAGLGAQSDVVAVGTPYLSLLLAMSFTLYLSIVFSWALRGAGDAVTPLWVLGLSNLLNAGLDGLLIFGAGPVPAMGVTGAAVATVVAQGSAAAVLGWLFFVRGRGVFTLRPGDLRPRWGALWQMFTIGIWGSGRMLILNISGLALTGMVATFGTAALAAYTVGLRLRIVVLSMGLGAFGGAAMTLVGQNIGAGRVDRAQRAGWLSTGVFGLLALAAACVMFFFAPQCIGWFNDDPAVVAAGGSFLRWTAFSLVFLAPSTVLGRAMNGAGDSFWPMVLTAITMLGLRIPLSWWLARLWLSPTGVWAALAASDVLQGSLFCAAFAWGRWKIIGQRQASAELR